MTMTTAAMLVAEERRRQITGEHWTAEHDDSHRPGVLMAAAACYIRAAEWVMARPGDSAAHAVIAEAPPAYWPWDASAWKPTADPARNMVKAAALICAEIDRHLRATGEDVRPDVEFEGEEPAFMVPASLVRALAGLLHNEYDGCSDAVDGVAEMRVLDALLDRPHFTDEYGSVWAGAPGAPDSTVIGDVLDDDHGPGPLTALRPWRWVRS